MVRTIDGIERRRRLAEAVWRVIRRDGYDAASVRTVAEEAGLATGSVRHFFPTQTSLRVFAMEALVDEVTDRATAAASRADDPRAAVRALLVELLPLRDTTRDDYLAHLQFIVRATVDPELAATARDGLGRAQDAYLRALQSLAAQGMLQRDVDPGEAASRLGILMDGIVLRILTSPELLSRAEAEAALDAFLDGVCGGAA